MRMVSAGFFLVAFLAIGVSPARADRWTGSRICINLDSVHITTDPSTHEGIVSFQMRRCDGGDIQWWAVTSEACHRPDRHIDGSDLLQWQSDSRVWMPPMFGGGLEENDPEVVDSGIACNWAYPSLFGIGK